MTINDAEPVTVVDFPSVQSPKFTAAQANAVHINVVYVSPLEAIKNLKPEQQMFALEHKIWRTAGLCAGDMHHAIAAKPAIANRLVELYQ